MKEIGNQAQLNDSVAVALDKNDSAMGSIAADVWSRKGATLGSVNSEAQSYGTKCGGIPDLQIDGHEAQGLKGGCNPFAPGINGDLPKPTALDANEKPMPKPEKPADGGPKDPIKEIVKERFLEGNIKKPFKPNSGDSIEFGETFVKPAPKPGKFIELNSSQNNTYEK